MISTTLLPLLALAGAAYAGPTYADPISMPLNRRTVLRRDLSVEKITAAADSLRFKYGIKSAVQKRQSQSAAIPILNQVCVWLFGRGTVLWHAEYQSYLYLGSPSPFGAAGIQRTFPCTPILHNVLACPPSNP